ncbi:MAG: hypothetical protein CL685_01590 [Candidatus Magasanikbacteria bacterium]|nr:hypothetical protein [Candidatus Magasanikbacteria bacterium]|tara:strand:- start:1621 stop:3363 length:1743 start_codon:yes stop_codon:yes gene_type:complete
MNGFGTIDDLLKKKPSVPGAANTSRKTPSASSTKTQQAFEKKMREVGAKEIETEAQRFAQDIGLPHIDLTSFPVSHAALRKMTTEQAKVLKAVCFFASQDEIRIGALDPSQEEVKNLLHELTERHQANGAAYVISQKSFDHVIDLYKTLPTVTPVSKDIVIEEKELQEVQKNIDNFDSFQDLLEKKSITDLVTLILGGGLKLDASDIHIEAEELEIMVRFRVDGVLHDAASIPKESYKRVISRIKLISSLKINITEVPQDGRFTIKLEEGDIDVRVSTIPTVYGESVVMRLLVQKEEAPSFEELGLRGQALERLQREVGRPNGMIIATGPTGSGKTTTLYSIMYKLNDPDVKIITLEDPVEYRMEGINQSQIDKSHEYTFAKGLRSMLRQDPDIAMVGEIRDLETADIAIQASLTGHLLLSTIHTNDAFGAIPRFLAMGVRPFLLAPALNCVIGQRLVRRLVDAHKVPAELTEKQLTQVQELIDTLPEDIKAEVEAKPLQFYSAPERTENGELGYKGRIGIYEIFTIDEDIEGLLSKGAASEYDIRELARKKGIITMAQDGVLKALDGLTSIEEVFRVIE